MGKDCMSKIALMLMLASTLLASCSLAPGMRMNESGLNEQKAAEEKAPEIDLVPITATLVAQQMQAAAPRSEAAATLPVDDSTYEYHVKPQDVLQIVVWDHPELTIPEGQYRSSAETGTLVHSDGSIFFPYVGEVEVVNKTLKEIRQLLTKRIADYVEKPQLDVRVAAFRSQKVYVTGQVNKPGEVSITDSPLHVLDAINAVGGVRERVSSTEINEADLEHVRVTRGGNSYLVDLQRMLQGGDVTQNYLLQDGDVVHVADNLPNKVFVLGEVKNPGAMMIHKGYLTLAEALGDVGGVDMASANPSQIYVIRSGAEQDESKESGFTFSAKPAVYRLDGSSPDAFILADQFRLKPRDVVFVSTAPIVTWGRVINQLQSTIQAIYLGRVAKIY